MRVILCDRCGVESEAGSGQAVHETTLSRATAVAVTRDLCESCYRNVLAVLQSVLPRRGTS